MKIRIWVILFCMILPMTAFAEKKDLGLHFSLETNSIYNFRGLNFFQSSSQHDQHFDLIPNIIYDLLDTGVWLNYRSIYQVTGDNISERIDASYGAEQNLGAGYQNNFINGKLTFNSSFYYYFYPFASSSINGTQCPSYIEPLAGLTYHSFVDAGMSVLYYLGVQSAVRDYSYLYVNPRIGKRFDISPMLSISTGAGFGYKLYKDYSNVKDNVYDVVVDLEVPIRPVKYFYVTPSVHYGWTNLRGVDLFDESMVYGGIRLGADI